jgi:polysaccharide deacetylase family protein (PEP-CTERM system associated)
VDVEDYFHVEAFADRISFADWPKFPSRVRRNTERILELFAEHNCRATFFVLGWVAERDPALVREIAAAGHEIACHSYAHRPVSTLTPDQFREDLRRACTAIEDAIGVQVRGYRAPTFSIVKRSLWALQILAEEGFVYDSSIFPVRHDLYGFPDAPRWSHQVLSDDGASIFEFPMSTVRLLGQNLPCGGGGYLRLLPMSYTLSAMKRIHRRHLQPAIVYFHPWELDSEQPRIAGSRKSNFRHYTGLGRMQGRITELLQRFKFKPLIEHVPELSRSGSLDPRAAVVCHNS